MKNTFFFLLTILIGLASCNEPVVIDTDLLDQDQANIQFKDDFVIAAMTITEDSILTYTPGNELGRYPFGNYIDPIFGQTKSSVYGQFRLRSPYVYPDFSSGSFDSIVLSVAYSINGSYGNTSETFGIEVLRLAENLDNDSSYLSTQNFSTEAMPIGVTSFVPTTTDSIEIFSYTDEIDTIKVAPQLRIRLDDALGAELFGLDTTAYESSENFLEHFKGIHLNPTTTNNGLLSFDMSNIHTRMTIYFNDGESPKEFSAYFTELSTVTVNYENDISGSIVEPYIDNNILGDSLVFVQGMVGPYVKLDFSDITNLNNIIVNKAELEVMIADLDDPSASFEPIEQLIVLEDLDGAKVLVEDAAVALTRARLDDFGGAISTTTGVDKYIMNISTHVHDMISGDAEPILYIQSFPKPSDFSRVVLYGANHSTFPIKLKLTYTQL